ncbi:MAG: ATP-binding protein [Thiotrichaceae bacterium]
MTKLFFTLFLVVLASFALFIGFMISLDTFGDDIAGLEEVNIEITKGTFVLLEKSIEGLDSQQIQAVVEQHQKAFGPHLGLFELSSLPLETDELARLEQGETVNSEEETDAVIGAVIKSTGNAPVELDFMYKRVPNTTLVWRLNFDAEVNTSIHNFDIGVIVEPGRYVNGMHYLIHGLLEKKPKEKWPQLIQELQLDYGLLLSIHNESALLAKLHANENSKESYSLITEGKVANITQNSEQATFVQRIPNSSKVLQIGPIQIPWLIRHFIHLMLLSFVLSIAVVLFLWVRPFWLNLIKIKQAANEFGSGNYSARIPYKKRSLIAEVTQAFNSMAEQTQRSIRSHKELTSAVSHELRTPVARMRFALEMLQSTDNKTDKSRFVSDINKDIDELDLLLEELLTYARFDQNDTVLKLSNERLVPWINSSMEKLLPLATDKTLNYQVEGIGLNEMALMEPKLMSRVLDNLVQNALRYANQHVEVMLTTTGSDYLLVVEDDGAGIPRSERKHIFDAFSRLDASRDRASGGFGLGLAIADRIVKGHQGSISIGDSVLGGARFEVWFPKRGDVPA